MPGAGWGDLTDAEGERRWPFLPVGNRRCGRWRDHRQVIDGIPHRVRTGFRWRDLPERCCLWRAHLGRLHQCPRISTRPAHAPIRLRPDSEGDRRPGTPSRDTVTEPGRPPGRSSAGGEGPGRSRSRASGVERISR
ncbi:transposase [Streptomyces hydrogenans]|uniref:transposase n=1 Tax=Streptomyces hydrogenans TaxID=1873719 RepID=UPI00365E631F